jgi:hypothetical protein
MQKPCAKERQCITQRDANIGAPSTEAWALKEISPGPFFRSVLDIAASGRQGADLRDPFSTIRSGAPPAQHSHPALMPLGKGKYGKNTHRVNYDAIDSKKPI